MHHINIHTSYFSASSVLNKYIHFNQHLRSGSRIAHGVRRSWDDWLDCWFWLAPSDQMFCQFWLAPHWSSSKAAGQEICSGEAGGKRLKPSLRCPQVCFQEYVFWEEEAGSKLVVRWKVVSPYALHFSPAKNPCLPNLHICSTVPLLYPQYPNTYLLTEVPILCFPPLLMQLHWPSICCFLHRGGSSRGARMVYLDLHH